MGGKKASFQIQVTRVVAVTNPI